MSRTLIAAVGLGCIGGGLTSLIFAPHDALRLYDAAIILALGAFALSRVWQSR